MDREDTVEFFCYGPGSEAEVVIEMIGKAPISATPAILHDFQLGVQGLGDIPDKLMPVPGHPGKMLPKTARGIMADSWPPDFETYVAFESPGSKIRGTVFKIRKADLPPIEDWELIDFGWYSVVKGIATLENGEEHEILTMAIKDQSIRREVDGMDYDNWLGKGDEFRREFLKHVRENYRRFAERNASGHGLESVTSITFPDTGEAEEQKGKKSRSL